MKDGTININLKVQDEDCLVVGGGKVAERKAKMLYDAGAELKIISPDLTDSFMSFIHDEKLDHSERKFKEEDVEDKFLIIAATSDREVNRKVSQTAKKRNALVNVVDDKDLSNFTLTADFSRGLLNIAVSTSGKSPALSAAIKERLKNEFGEAYEKYLKVLSRLRPEIIKKYPAERRREILLGLGDNRVERALSEGDLEKALDSAFKNIPKELEEMFINILKDVEVDSDGEFDHRD